MFDLQGNAPPGGRNQCLHAYMLTCLHAYMFCMLPCLHAYMFCMLACFHVCMLTSFTGFTQFLESLSGSQGLKLKIFEWGHTDMQRCRCADKADMQVWWHADMLTCRKHRKYKQCSHAQMQACSADMQTCREAEVQTVQKSRHVGTVTC